MKLVFPYLLVLFFLASCTVQKRIHRPGWHVQWNSKKNVSKTITKKPSEELTSKEANVEKSTQELSESISERKREEVNSVELIENQSKAEVLPIEQTNYEDDGPQPEQSFGEASQKERELAAVESEKSQNSDLKSKERGKTGIVFFVLGCVCIILTVFFLGTIFLGTILGLHQIFALVLLAIFGFLFILLGLWLMTGSKKEKITE